MNTVILVTLTYIRPVKNIDLAARTVINLDTSEPWISNLHEIGLMFTRITCTFTLESVAVDATSVKIGSEYLPLVMSGPVLTLINHHSTMCMTTACLIGAGGHALSFKIGPVLLSLVPMIMVCGLIDKFVKMLIEVLSVHTLEIGPRNTMPKVTYDGIDEKELSMFVPIVTPRVCCTLADDLKAMANRVVSPNRASQLSALLLRSSRSANVRGRSDAMPPI